MDAARNLTVTSRADLRAASGVNTHFCFNPSIYAVGKKPNQTMIDDIVAMKVAYIRERWQPTNAAQQVAFTQLAAAGVRFYLFVGDMTYGPADIANDVAALAASPFVNSVEAVCGPNEPNKNGGTQWPSRVTRLQQAIYQSVFGATSYAKFASDIAVVGPALKHNVPDVDGDYQAVAAAGIQRWCSAGDFHFYPGNAGPIQNAGEAVRAQQAYGQLPLWQSETGWTNADTTPEDAGRFSVEAYLRNHLTGIVGTLIYELGDESQYVQGREGLFGLVTPTAPKVGFTSIQTLLAPADGNEDFPGTLAAYQTGVDSDAQIVVTSEGNGNWTVYLLQQTQNRATLVLPASYVCDTGNLSIGGSGAKRYTINFAQTMMVAHVSPTPGMQHRNPRGSQRDPRSTGGGRRGAGPTGTNPART